MKTKTTLRNFLALAGSSLLAISYTHATIVNWDGDTSATWATAGNWDTAPTNSLTADIANFNLSTYGGNPVFAPTVGTATSINGITIGALNGTMTLTNTAALSIGGSGITIANGAGAFTISGTTTLGAAQNWTNSSGNLFTFGAVTAGGNLLTIGGSGNTTASGIIAGTNGALTKEGAGLLTLNAANTYTGATTVNGGELRWGVANAIAAGALNVNDGGTANIQTFADNVGTITIAKGGTINGTSGILGTGSGGFISNGGGTMSGFSAGAGLQLATNAGITYSSTGPGSTTLQIDRVSLANATTNHVFNIADGDAAVDFEITETVTAPGGANVPKAITKTGAGVMQFSGSQANTTVSNTMPLNVNEGIVLFNKSAEVNAIASGAITIGDNSGSAGSAILRYATGSANNQIGTNAITINSDGLFDLNGKSESLGGVTVSSTGQLQLNNGNLTVTSLTLNPSDGNTTTLSLGGTGILTLGGNVTFNAAGTGRAQITGSEISMGSAGRTFTIGLGAGVGEDLLIDAEITGASRLLTKAGAGRLTLSNSNTYTGGTTVSAGTLLLSGAFNMPDTGTLTVSSGGTFSLADGTARATTGATTGSGLNLAAGSSLAFDWNGSSLDSFTTTGTATTVAGAVAISINNTSPTGSGGTLLTAASGLDTATYLLANNTNYTATISKTATTVSIGAQSAATALTNAYWLGGQVTGALGAMALTSDSTSNWASDAAGTSAAGVVPGGSAVNVIFGATGAAQQANVTTGADMNLGSITFNDSAAVTIGGGNAITLNSTSGTAATTSGALATVTAGSAISVTSFANSTNTISANLLLGANQTWNVASGKTLVVSGQVAGDFGLTKADAGTVTLTGTSTYSGTTTISAGTLQIGNGSTTGSLNINSAIVNNASLVFNRSNAVTQGTDFASGISGTGSVTQAGSNTLTLSGTNTYQGGTFLNAGTLATSADTNFGTGGGITVGGTSTWNMGGAVLITYDRDLTINSGTLTLNSGNSAKTVTGILSGSGGIVGGNSTGYIFTNTGNTFTGTVNNGYQMLFASLGDSSNPINLVGSNSEFQWTGGAKTFSLRPFTLQAPTTAGATEPDINNNGSGALIIQQDLAITGTAGARTLNLGGTNTGSNTFAGNITDGSGSVVTIKKGGVGTWVLSGTANSYTGGTTVSAGTLGFANGALGSSGTINASGGTLLWNTGNTQDISSRLAMTAATTSTFDTNGNNVTFATGFGGSTTGLLTKTGAGTLLLNGTNTYTGLTTVNAGVLGGTGTIAGSVTVATAGSLAPGASAGTLSIGGGLTVTAMATGTTGKLNFELGANTAASDQIAVTGTLTIGTGVLGFSDFTFSDLGWQNGTYVLINSGGISGTLDPDLIDRTGLIGSGQGELKISGNNLVLEVTGLGGGPGPLDHFAISAISSPQTVGTPITGITLTAQDAANQTVTSFTGTVNFSGTGGFTGTSATFTAGVLNSVSVTPTNAGSNLTLIVTDGVSGKTGLATITTIQTQYAAWAGGAAFNADANGDGVKNGLAFLLGATNPSENAIGRLPTVTQSGGNLILTFNCLPVGARGTATLKVSHSTNLGSWTTTTNVVPNATNAVPDNNVTFVVGAGPVGPPALNSVTATINSAAAAGGKLFGRLEAVNP